LAGGRWEKRALRIGHVAEWWSGGPMTTVREQRSRVTARQSISAGQGRLKGNGVWACGPVWASWHGPV
jgi:hypothetical protein